MNNEALSNQIAKFLKTRKNTVTDDDYSVLWEIFQGIISSKWELNDFGDNPIEFVLNDESKGYMRDIRIPFKPTPNDIEKVKELIRELQRDLSVIETLI